MLSPKFCKKRCITITIFFKIFTSLIYQRTEVQKLAELLSAFMIGRRQIQQPLQVTDSAMTVGSPNPHIFVSKDGSRLGAVTA